jgi:S-DNA-T family DNA segregation ATPase FtsK/SpoIIIE
VDSATIIDQPGAQALIGRGDMLFSEPCALTRLQCAFVDTPEVKRLVDYIASQPSPTGMPYSLPDYEESGGSSTAVSGSVDSGMGSESGAAIKYDALFADIARDAVGGGENFSTSYIQRTYEVGFVRAGRIMLQLERAGIVGPQVPGAKSRDVKITDPYALEAKLQELGVI